jgi:inhibitor of KinA
MDEIFIDKKKNTYRIYSLGDQAITIEFSEKIDDAAHQRLLAVRKKILDNPFIGFQDLVPAYTTLSIFYDVLAIRKKYTEEKTAFEFVKKYLIKILDSDIDHLLLDGKIIEIPVKYDGEDLDFVCEYCQISQKELIALHTAPLYKVYMIGFLPGFPYLGGLDKQLEVPRKATPRLRVNKGSVGLAGQQTGIYPQNSPGGWQLIGSTEVELFCPANTPPTLLQAGDFVKFVEYF